MSKPKVAFVCVHNSCRSQIAEALGKIIGSDVFESYSAGTHITDEINNDALRLVNEIYDIDMSVNQTPKLIWDLPPVDIVVTMGCNVECPSLPSKHREDWGLDDPTGKEDQQFISIIKTIEFKMQDLKNRIESGKIEL